MRVNFHWIKVALTGLGAVGALGAAAAVVKPPPLTPVAVLKTAVTAYSAVTASQITWVKMEHPPHGTVTAWVGDPLAARALPAGTVLTQSDFTHGGAALGLTASEVRAVFPITAASAAVPLGTRVDVWSEPTTSGSGAATPQLLATGVRVIGLYTSAGAPVGATASSGGLLSGGSSTPAAPGLVALAVPASALPTLMQKNPEQTVLLVDDPARTHFALASSPASTAATTRSTTAPKYP